MRLYFKWDSNKAKVNRRRPTVSFEQAASIFLGPRAVTIFGTEHSEREDLWVTRGMDKNRILMARRLAGQFSIRINDRWRICFKWVKGKARDVEIGDCLRAKASLWSRGARIYFTSCQLFSLKVREGGWVVAEAILKKIGFSSRFSSWALVNMF